MYVPTKAIVCPAGDGWKHSITIVEMRHRHEPPWKCFAIHYKGSWYRLAWDGKKNAWASDATAFSKAVKKSQYFAVMDLIAKWDEKVPGGEFGGEDR
jgi:hypothetical protein